MIASRPAWSPVRVVVLQAAVDVVRIGHVKIHIVKLLDRDVGDEGPVVALVPSGIQATVVAEDHVVRIGGVDPEVVVIHVNTGVVFDLHRKRREGVAAVGRAVDGPGDQVHGLVVVGVDAKLAVVHGALVEFVDALPAFAAVGRLEDPAVFGFDHGHDQSRIAGGDRQSDPPLVALRQAVGQLAPAVAAVGALVEAAARTASDEPIRPPLALVRRRVENGRIGRVHGEIHESRVLVDVEDLLPAVAPVGGSVDAPLLVGAEEVAQRRHPHPVGIGWVNDDPADVLRVFEPGQPPGLAAVAGVVDPLSPRRAVAVVGFTGPDPHFQWIRWCQRNISDGQIGLIVEDRGPGGAVVDALPHAARRGTDVDVGLRARDDLDDADAAARDRGADGAPCEAGGDAGGGLGGEAGCGEQRQRQGGRSRNKALERRTRGVNGHREDSPVEMDVSAFVTDRLIAGWRTPLLILVTRGDMGKRPASWVQ